MSRNTSAAALPRAAKPTPVRPPRRPRLRRPRRAGQGPRWDLAGVALAWLAGLT